jgi:hypothetical protein
MSRGWSEKPILMEEEEKVVWAYRYTNSFSSVVTGIAVDRET